jgi:fucose 4-O-acetylase-like acetyltransferase
VDKTQTSSAEARSRIIAEFNWLKIVALALLIFVHSDLIIVYPNIIYPVQWFLLSAFLFISGFLAYDSFYRRGESMRRFFKTKAKSLYVPFLVATVVYFMLQIFFGMKPDPFYLVSQTSFLNMFDVLNAVYNWGFLWFIPYLFVFMLILCLLEKYVKSVRIQLLMVSLLWLSTILLWVYDSPLRLGQLFSQFFLVFMFGFWVNKLKIYEKIMSFKIAFIAFPVVMFFSVDLSGFFTYENQVEAFKGLLYSNVRIIVFTLGLVLLSLLFLRKIRIPKNGFVKRVASKSVFIYLCEPFITLMLVLLFFGRTEIYFAEGTLFWAYQLVRVVVLLILLPLGLIAIKTLYDKKTSAKIAALPR